MVKRKRYNTGALFNAARLGFRAGRFVKRAYQGYKTLTTSKGKRYKETAPLTSQHDFRVTYQKKRMPKRKRKAYVKSVKRFRAMTMKNLPARIFQFVSCNDYNSGANASRYFGAFMGLYSNNWDDTSFTNVMDGIAGGSSAAEKLRAGGFRLDHMGLRCVIRNTDQFAIDLDVYKVICIRDIPIATWNQTPIENMHAFLKNTMRQAAGMDIEVGATGTGISTTTQNAGFNTTTQVVGDMLWNNPPFLRYWKILKQFKIQLPAGNTTEFNMRSTKNKYIPYNQVFDADRGALAAKAYVTQGYIFNINGRASIIGGVSSFDDVSCILEKYVRYNVKAVEGSSPTLVYDAA